MPGNDKDSDDSPDSDARPSHSPQELNEQARSAFRGAANKARGSALFRTEGIPSKPPGWGAAEATLLSPRSNRPDGALPMPKSRVLPRSDPGEFRPQHAPATDKPARIKGVMPRALRHWIVRSYGDSAIDVVASFLSKDIGFAFKSDAFNVLEWHPIETVELLFQATVHALCNNDLSVLAEIAKENYEHDLAAAFRAPSLTPDLLVRRAPVGWEKILDFGTIRVLGEPPAMTLVFEGANAVHASIRHAILGTMRGTMASSKAAVEISAGGTSYASALELSITW